MQPRTEVKFDPESFRRIKRTIRNMSLGRKNLRHDPAFAMEYPDEVGIQLTNRCNLRCKHCFQWNDSGFYHHFDRRTQNGEISFAVVDKILKETSEVKSNLYLWGGEPLCYGEWGALAAALEKDPRWTVFCTNGVDIETQLDSILKISGQLAMLISVDGFETENDAVRGRGTYRKVMTNIDLLLDLKRKGIYQGEVSVNCVIGEKMIGQLYDLALMFEARGINSLYFCFPWYIPETAATRMDQFFREQFDWLRPLDQNGKASWHSYTYTLNPGVLEALMADLARINGRTWKIRLRYQPALESGEIRNFVAGRGEVPAQNRTQCVAITNRMNVMPDGKVTACKLFPEFEIGDLNTDSVIQVWKSLEFQKIRNIVSRGLMPVCSKCVLLYLHGV
jgi:radical SAM protein with 4Fe4S-binding SPASM domain